MTPCAIRGATDPRTVIAAPAGQYGLDDGGRRWRQDGPRMQKITNKLVRLHHHAPRRRVDVVLPVHEPRRVRQARSLRKATLNIFDA